MRQPYELLEAEWAEFNQLDPAGMVACNSGTSALHLALEALQLPPQSEVLVPDYTMIACARAVSMAALTPVFVDCDGRLIADYGLMWNQYLAKTENERRVKVIMSVHTYGRDAQVWERLFAYLAGTSINYHIVEDLAEAHGIRPSKVTDAACWSFYQNKIVFGAEGGAVWFRDPEHAELARQLRCLGFTDAHDYSHLPRGHNYRMSNVHAEMIRMSLNRYDENVKRRREVESWYDEYCPAEWRMPARDAVWIYDVRVPELNRATMAKVVGVLNEKGIAARQGFWPMTFQQEYRGQRLVSDGKWDTEGHRAAVEGHRVFYLPVHPYCVSREDCKRAFQVIGDALGDTVSHAHG